MRRLASVGAPPYAARIGLPVRPEPLLVERPACPPRLRRCHVAALRCRRSLAELRTLHARCPWSYAATRDCAPVTLERCDAVEGMWL